MICEGKKKFIKEQFYKGVQKQREKREGREINREQKPLVMKLNPTSANINNNSLIKT